MQVLPGKKIYFLSDFHLGAPNSQASLLREKRIINFLNKIKTQAQEIFIVGDMFDFWYEYRRVVPKGHVRLLGKLAEITDNGVPVHFFVGNHDMWMKDYLQQELNIPVYTGPKKFEFNGKKFLVAHGDGLGPGDHRYKAMKKVFRHPVAQWLFGVFPPYIGMGLANYLSRKSRESTGKNEEVFLGEEKEWLIQYCKAQLQEEHFDYLIFGHRHLAIDYSLAPNSRYINLGDWITYFTYAYFDGNDVRLTTDEVGNESKIVRRS